tara:strand:+ start:938 stop:1366 length:429 start_codon:yes stop_codon:yes gene_type:complete
MRHWKQRYDFDADLIFTRRMKLGICGVAVVHPGDDVTAEMKEQLGRNRLKLWWESKRVALRDFDGDLGRVISREERIDREGLEARKAEAQREQEQLDADHNLGGPSVAPEVELEADEDEESDLLEDLELEGDDSPQPPTSPF